MRQICSQTYLLKLFICVILTFYNLFFGPEAYMIYGTITENDTTEKYSTTTSQHTDPLHTEFQSIISVEDYYLTDKIQINNVVYYRSSTKNKIPCNTKRFWGIVKLSPLCNYAAFSYLATKQNVYPRDSAY